MQVLVKKPHIKIDAENIPDDLLSFLKNTYGEVIIIPDPEEELLEVKESSLYATIKDSMTSAENVRLYRGLRGWTQEELGIRLGNIAKQNISNIERGTRSISKEMAKRLSRLFDVPTDKFL